jgi:site-specific recombinase XerC
VKPGVHILRHTFCSHLAMRCAPARAIQELGAIRTWRRRSARCT